jgi:hypothetical protein
MNANPTIPPNFVVIRGFLFFCPFSMTLPIFMNTDTTRMASNNDSKALSVRGSDSELSDANFGVHDDRSFSSYDSDEDPFWLLDHVVHINYVLACWLARLARGPGKYLKYLKKLCHQKGVDGFE